MAKNSIETYSCDKCGKRLKSYQNSLDIVTSLHEGSCWSRLHVKILHRHGVHNDAEQEDADLCKSCAVKILSDALARVKRGERATAGAGAIEEQKWDA